jgi:hypothetical protein
LNGLPKPDIEVTRDNQVIDLNANADFWEEHCNKVCSDMGIDCQRRVYVQGYSE